MKTNRIVKSLAAIIVALTILLPFTGCIGPSGERNAFTVIEGQRATVIGALEGWNEWLGVQQRVVAALPEPQKSVRIAEIQSNELKVVAALDEYNKAQRALTLAWDEYDRQRIIASNSPPDLSLVLKRSQQVTSASTALIQIIAIWIPQLTQPK